MLSVPRWRNRVRERTALKDLADGRLATEVFKAHGIF